MSMAEKVQAIVIRSSDRKEKDKNVLLFSIEQGKVWATLKGVKGANAKMKMAQNPFCFGEFVLEEGKVGCIVTGFDSIENFHELSEDVDKFFEGSAILEVINKLNFSTKDERAEVFLLTLKSLKTLCFGNAKPLYVLNKFLIELFKICGFPLNTEKCSCCGTKAFEKLYIDYSVGQLVCFACKSFSCDEVSKTTFMALKILNSLNFDKLSTLSLSQDSERVLLRLLVKNFESRFDSRLNFIGILS